MKLILFIECEKNKTGFQGVILPVVISTSEILEKNINLLLNHCQHQYRPCMSHKPPIISRLKFLKTYDFNLLLLNNIRSIISGRWYHIYTVHFHASFLFWGLYFIIREVNYESSETSNFWRLMLLYLDVGHVLNILWGCRSKTSTHAVSRQKRKPCKCKIQFWEKKQNAKAVHVLC